jgi:hypothetical protein
MKQTLKNTAGYGVLGLLIILACAPLGNLLNSANTPPVEVSSATVTNVAVSEQTPTAIVSGVPASTNTPVLQSTPLPPASELYAFIQAPEGPLAQPYVTLIGFQDVPDVSIEIRGSLNSNEFICRGSPCAVPVLTSSNIAFRAVSSAGATSDTVSATVRVDFNSDGYYVYIDTVSQFATFSDSCLRSWRFQDYTDPVWAEFVQFPYQLNTNKTLHYLSTQLIIHGIVDVGGCPAGGLSIGLNWPTGCGLERSRDAMIEWQNQYDEYIWLASRDVGIPPKILKTLIEVESQFWPGNERFYVDEVGLGQVNQLGVDVLLRRNPTLYQQVCSTVLDDCAMPYSLMSPQNQAMIRGAFVNSQSSVCPSCQYGLDLNTAKQSISFIAQVLQANCETVRVVADANRPAGYIDDLEDPYSDFWKFTLFTYHSGISCFEKAVKASPKGVPLDWETLSENTDCDGGEEYVDGVWGNLLSFDLYRYSASGQVVAQVTPEFAPTRTPLPTPIVSTAQALVRVFLDRNQNGIPEDSEWLNNITVILRASDGTEVTGITVNGNAVLELAKFQIGSEITVSLPAYYRSETITGPVQGMVPVTFIFIQPTLPTAIP